MEVATDGIELREKAPLTEEMLQKMDAYWLAGGQLSLGGANLFV